MPMSVVSKPEDRGGPEHIVAKGIFEVVRELGEAGHFVDQNTENVRRVVVGAAAIILGLLPTKKGHH